MSNLAVKKRDIPEDLFEDASSFDESEPLSKEMSKLLDKVGKRLSTREKNREHRKKRKTVAAATFERARFETEQMMKSGDWDKCAVRHLVALYDIMHEKCYGVEDASLGPAERYNATMMAANLTRHEFDGKFVEVIEFMRWVWKRELSKEKWLRENNKPLSRRVTYYDMFGKKLLLTDYKIYLARTS